MAKSIWVSKTFWVNVLAVVGDIILNMTGHALPAGWDITALGIINLILRTVTKQPVSWT